MFHYELLEELSNQIKYCKDPKELFVKTIQFVENKVPENIWSTHKDEIKNEQSPVNSYLTELSRHIQKGDETITYKFFETAIITYNTGRLLNVVDNEDLLFKVFTQTVNQQKK